MISSLTNAPCGAGLVIQRIADPSLERRLARMGLFPSSVITRLDEEVALHTVRVRGPRGEVVLSGGMGGKVIVHLEDGRMLPLPELHVGDKGHIEAVTAGESLLAALAALGLKNDDEIELLRRLPPMEYVTVVEGRGRIRLPEGMAAKILGVMGNIECQFVNAQAGSPFLVRRILGGERAQKTIALLDIREGGTLRLESVEKAPSYRMSSGDRIIVSSHEGLRLFLRVDQADLIIVNSESGEA
ncbi:FeoA family protein [Oleidesulfovibrio alaskensis]|jgi:Fe2+ transport system protein FeoA|uniref:FeoA family protein n=1 Tax=Oleidesulfovibrio alaskensis TaxID=58180 RepID=UPI001A4844C8|nr:FeoA family protein [Oleidesulfovibrio alaskensis]MBL3583078.1 ferrous iron transport protein A [Oleidesulfovibrio alaskensis]